MEYRRYSRLRTNLRLLTTLLICGICSLSVAMADDFDEYMSSAQTFVENGDLKSAVIELKNAVQLKPKDPRARLLLAETYIAMRNGAAAQKEIERARDLGLARTNYILLLCRAYILQGELKSLQENCTAKGEDADSVKAEIHSILSQSYVMQRELALAEKEINSALAYDSNSIQALLGKARLAFFRKNYKVAEEYISKAIAVNDQLPDVWMLKGELHRANNEYELALQAFDQVLQRSPGNTLANLGKASIYLVQENYKAANQAVKATDGDKNYIPLRQYLVAVLAVQEGDLDTAQQELQLLLEVVPNHSPSKLLLGSVSYSTQQFEAAERYLSSYLTTLPGHLPASKLLSAVYMKMRNYEKVVAVLKPLLALHPQDYQLAALLGTAYLHSRKFSESAKYLEQALSGDLNEPDAAKLRSQLALAYIALGKSEQAIEHLDVVAQNEDTYLQSQILLVQTHLQAGEFDKALEVANALSEKLPDSPVAHSLINMAYLGKGDATSARSHLEQALLIQPDYLSARFSLARINEVEGAWDKALEEYTKILKVDKTNMRAMLGSSRALGRLGKAALAVQMLEEAQKANPDALDPAILLANYHLSKNDNLKALAIANELEQKNPQDQRVLRLLGIAQLASGSTASGVVTLEKLISQYPNNADYHLLLAQAYIGQKSYAKSEASLRQVLTLNPKSVKALVLLGSVALKNGDSKKALEIAKQIQNDHPDSAIGFQLEGDIHRGAKRFEKALATYQQAFDRDKNTKLLLMLSESYKHVDNAAQALVLLQDWVQEYPQDLMVRFTLAAEYLAADEQQKAISEYEAIYAQDKNNMIVLNNLAWLYVEQGDPRGVKYAKAAYDIQPERVEVMDTYGWALVNDGKPEKGLALLADAIAKAPHLPDVRYHYAYALHASGETEKASRELSRLLKEHKTFTSYHAAKALFEKLAAPSR